VSDRVSLATVAVVAVLGIAALLAFWLIRRQRRGRGGSERQRAGAKRSAVLLVGECGAGKTVLFHRLVDGAAVASVTSMKESEASQWPVGDSGQLRTLVDLPGHGRLSYLQRQFAPIAGVVVLVLDALNFQRHCRPVAERLYDLLTLPDALLVPVVVACNKHDILTAADATVVRRELLRELNELRTTRAVQPRAASSNKLGGAAAGGGGSGGGDDDDDDDVNGATLLGVDGEPLTWEQVPVSVDFVECSGRTGEGTDRLVEAIAAGLR
jgi:signal recognition particle receptor subunit beta